jgi:hypothetical protein
MELEWLRRLVAGLSSRKPGFAPGSVCVVFVMDKVILGQVFLPVVPFFPVSIIPPWLYVLIYHLLDEQQARWWPQFRDILSPHRHKHEHGIALGSFFIDKHYNSFTFRQRAQYLLDIPKKAKQSRYKLWWRLGERRYSSNSFLTLALDGGKWSASRPEERTPGTHCSVGWVGLRAGLDTEVRRKILCPCLGSNLER